MKRKPRVRLNLFQYKELSKYCFNLSLLIFASLFLKYFEPGSPGFNFVTMRAVLIGLLFGLAFVMIGLLLSREVKK